MVRSNESRKTAAIKTFLKSTPPGRLEEALQSITGLQRRRRRTVLLLRAFLIYLGIEYAQSHNHPNVEELLFQFGMSFFGIIIILHFIALQLEGKRIRQIAKLSGGKRLSIAKVLRREEVR